MAFICNVHVHVDLWMVGLCWVPNSNQDTQASIEFYHGALKQWFSFETKSIRGHCIDWLVWKLIMTMAQHYMHQVGMKRQGFIKNKVVAWLVAISTEKTLLIPHANVIHLPLVVEDKVVHGWCRANIVLVSYAWTWQCVIIFMFLSLNMNFTREWALRGNLWKHQVVWFHDMYWPYFKQYYW